MTEHLCTVCAQLRPAAEPRVYNRAHVCDGCRNHLGDLLDEMGELYGDIELQKSTGGAAKVSGSRTAPLPLAVRSLDLIMPPRLGAVADDLVPQYERVDVPVEVYRRAQPGGDPDRPYPKDVVVLSHRRRRRDEHGYLAYGASGDQVGDVSIATMLETWARDWQTYEWAELPGPTVPLLLPWLHDRLEWACDHHPAVDDFAHELAQLVGKLRPRPEEVEIKTGVPCRQCDNVTLYRRPRSPYVECGSCASLLTAEEYERWTHLIAMPEHQPWVRRVLAEQRSRAQEGTT